MSIDYNGMAEPSTDLWYALNRLANALDSQYDLESMLSRAEELVNTLKEAGLYCD